ncbi:MAG: hypothetical protein ACM3Q2_17940 [Syntrophothermus sp.]
MLNFKSENLFNSIWFISVFFLMNMAINAQDNNRTAHPSNQVPYSSSENIDSSKKVWTPESQGQSPATQDLSFNTAALQLSNELIQKTGLSTDNSEKISKILVNYRNEIAKARNYYYENQKEIKENEDQKENKDNENVTGSQSKVDMTGILGNNVEQYYIGSAPSMMKDFKEADRKTDSKIKDLFDNDVQKSRYDQFKTQWWNDVKAKVFSTLNTSAQSQTK